VGNGRDRINKFSYTKSGRGNLFPGALPGWETPFILQFNTAGVRKWATYYGGSNDDVANSISSDGKNVWVTGFSASADFPTLNPGGGAYFQGAPASINGNAFILQFNASGVRKWATYYGGDIGYSIQSDGNNVWVCGSTPSDFPTLNSGCGFFQDTLGGGQDVFILGHVLT